MEITATCLAALRSSILHVQVHMIVLIFVSIVCLHPADCLSKSGNETDRLALMEFKANIGNDPYGIFSSWNDSIHFCEWRGITCGHKHQRVVSINLQG
ncbi:hypothetical protein RCOM_0592430 [Ricinus communis]|uniref:Leucine-rich repeat-containing N-terminal plant-type domain-containing protein n=1 Tax=Ricinus communis TaxID=3988 RepID=B9SLK6_RICCO|nr:hypothetical protein RCOM_0592430 [Ricinus communis]